MLLFSMPKLLLGQDKKKVLDSVQIQPSPRASSSFDLNNGGGLTGGPYRVSLFGESKDWVIGFNVDRSTTSMSSPDFEIRRRVTTGYSESQLLGDRDRTSIIAKGDLKLHVGFDALNDPNFVAHMTIKSNGYVGVGTNSPNEKLELYNGNFRATYSLAGSTTGIFNIKPNFANDRVWLGTISTHNLTLAAGNKGVIDLNKDGYAVIFRNGEYPTTLNISAANRGKYSLFVLGGILSEDYAIGPRATWADHVFNKEYKLMDLKEVENYINTNNRLPDIPSASEVEADGYSLHEMNVKLLQKVEELTLYSIQQNKRIEQLEKMVNSSK